MDMWDPYVTSVRERLADADQKIVFDKFHVAQHLGQAVDEVRRKENKSLRAKGDERLVGTRYDWLRNPTTMDAQNRRSFARLRDSELKTARAWALKETAMLVPLHLRGPRAETLPVVAQLGGAQPSGSHDRGGWHARTPLRQHHHLPQAPHHQRGQRIHQRQDSMGEVQRQRLSEQTELHQRDLLSLRRLDLARAATK
jgi:Transposase